MNHSKFSHFVEHYSSLDDRELLDIYQRRASLTEEAITALEQVVARRGTDITKLQEIEKKELESETAYEQEQLQKAEKRDARYLKIFWVVAIPLIIFSALFRSERFLETFVSSLTQAILLGGASWGYLKFKRSRSRRKP